MRALVCSRFGPVGDLAVEERPQPVPAEQEVVVRVEAAGLNYPDALMVQGKYQVRPPLPFVPLGIVPEFGSTFLLPMLAGYQRAAELLLLGQPFGVEKASAAGFVTEVVAEAEVIERARAAARALAALPPESVRLTKGLMRGPLAAGVAAQMAEELRLFSLRVTSPEAREALGAFFEKRKPVWKNK